MWSWTHFWKVAKHSARTGNFSEETPIKLAKYTSHGQTRCLSSYRKCSLTLLLSEHFNEGTRVLILLPLGSNRLTGWTLRLCTQDVHNTVVSYVAACFRSTKLHHTLLKQAMIIPRATYNTTVNNSPDKNVNTFVSYLFLRSVN